MKMTVLPSVRAQVYLFRPNPTRPTEPSQFPFVLEPSEEEEGDGGGSGGGMGGAGAGEKVGASGGGSAGAGSVFDDALDELRPSRPSSAAEMLAQMWEQDPATSSIWTSSCGGGVA